MEKLEIGGKFSALAGRPEGTFFDITESGPVWIFNYANPTTEEISDVSEGSPFEIRMLPMKDVLWFFVKCGSQEWAEAPYTPHLSKAPNLNPIKDDREGYALTLLMVDASTQTIRHIRMLGLGNKFSRQLKRNVDNLLTQPFDKALYDLSIRKTQAVYSTDQLAKNCRDYWRSR